MKLFIWNNTDPVSTNYHSNGGLVICAENLDNARRLLLAGTRALNEKGYAEATEERKDCDALREEPDHILELNGEWLLVFPNAGCC